MNAWREAILSYNVVCDDDYPFKPKPNPEIFLEAARRINIKSDLCQVFKDGDSGQLYRKR